MAPADVPVDGGTPEAPAVGLTAEEARRRLAEVGPNEVLEPPPHPVLRFLRHFWGVTPLMLEATIVLEVVIGRALVAYLITGLLVFNAVLGFSKESRAARAIEALKHRLSIMARVRRDGTWTSIVARELVPGDIMRLRAGDIVPADARLIDGSIEVDQSALTGESAMVRLVAGSSVLSGTTVRRGECTNLVTATGERTQYGRTVELISIAHPRLHLEEYTASVAKWLLLAVGILLAVSVAVAIVEGIDPAAVVSLAVILLVTAIPVALPTMFILSVAFGSLQLAGMGAIITRLAAVDDAAMMDVLCVDKTGTITTDRLGVSRVVPAPGRTEKDVLLHASLASEAANKDPIDLAILARAEQVGVNAAGFGRDSFEPFDPATRMTRATVTKDGQQVLVVKGAVKTVLAMCDASEPAVGSLASAADGLAEEGDRVIAVASSSSGAMKPMGLVALRDALRENSADLVKELSSLGVSVKMLTGDSLPVAKKVGRAIGLEGRSMTMADFKAGSSGQVKDIDVLAETLPTDKYDVVKALQGEGHIVGMTGDGVNDAPALKQAEVGIAVKDATDAARGAASAVLTAEGLEGIVELVRVGRETYERVMTWVLNKVVKTSNIVVFVVLAFLLTRSFVVATLQMVLLLILTDYVTLSIATDRVRARVRPERMAVAGTVRLGVIYGAIMVVESMLLFLLGRDLLGTGPRLQTFIFVWLVLSNYLTVLSVRERGHFWASRPSEPLILAVVIGALIALLLSTYGLLGLAPVPPWAFGLVLLYAVAMVLLVNDAIKVAMARSWIVPG